MNPQQTQSTSQQDASAAEWFRTVQQTPDQPPTRKVSKRTILLIVLIVLTVIMMSLLFFFSPGQSSKATACLTKDDYQALTGSAFGDEEEFAPAKNFFTYSVHFTDGSSNYDPEDKPSDKDVIMKVGDFYKSRDGKSIIINVSTEYVEDTDLSLSNERLTAITNDLIAAGVSESVIIKNSSKIEVEEESEPIRNALISIRSDETCTQ